MSTTTTMLTAASLRQALESSDAKLLNSFYAMDAELTVVDKIHGPSKPLVLRGNVAIAQYWNDVCARAMTHTVEHLVATDDTFVYNEACLYPDGTRVRCIAVLDLVDGLIVKQVGVQAWDE